MDYSDNLKFPIDILKKYRENRANGLIAITRMYNECIENKDGIFDHLPKDVKVVNDDFVKNYESIAESYKKDIDDLTIAINALTCMRSEWMDSMNTDV